MEARKVLPYVFIILMLFALSFVAYLLFTKIPKTKTYENDVSEVEILRLENSLQYVKFRGHEYFVNGRSTPLHLPDCKSIKHLN